MEETVTIEDLANLLGSLNEFDPVVISSLIAGYLLMFVLGYSAGTVIKLLKRS